MALSAVLCWASGAQAQDTSQPAANPPDQGAPANAGAQGAYSDPLAWFNEPVFTFNRKVDDWVVHPVASAYATVAPDPAREAVGRFFDNVRVIPRVANNAFQLRFGAAGTEVARFGVNTTVGLLGFFDPAQNWFGIEPSPNDFGLTIRTYGVPTGPYLMLPLLGPSTVGDTVGIVTDGLMDPMSWLLPAAISIPTQVGQRAATFVNYRSLHLDQFAEVDRYAIDLYGAVQDAYMQTRENETKKLRGEGEE
jgi:phospholipid-binding lipoprotein MlaA